MAHLQRIAVAVLCFIVGLSPTVISFVLFICTGYADSKQRSRWVSTRHVLLRARPKKSQALDGPQVRKEVKYLIIKMFNLTSFMYIIVCRVEGERPRIQEILKKQPKFGSFTAFLHGLFPNCFLILTRVKCWQSMQKSNLMEKELMALTMWS